MTANAVGAASLLVQVPWKPSEVLPPGAMTALYERFLAVTASPLWVAVEFQPFVIFWSPGNVKVSVQLLMAVAPVSVIVRLATNPPGHSLDFTQATLQVEVDVVGDAEADGEEEAEAEGDIDGEDDAAALALLLALALALALADALPWSESPSAACTRWSGRSAARAAARTR